MRSAMSVLLEETAFGGHASLSLRIQALPIFSNISRLPADVLCARRSKVPAILRDLHELDAEQAVL